ncbi:thiol reductant ABC exporter subunit CydD [Thioalkalivibrio paradoxus]|uniref:ABC transporter permease n=1 Tax=Thioalkalivibrio paradoxus ARh 1 TaxID=713585 RepID=W0DQR5_9GAMM|nr:thiol reductant ABC exporter subunit CydD [Thioalkalivibrio paradoxus]AHE99180.1 ABC transporter permease [Thioalkalivibrio paradoxus ARh 1]
MPTESPPSPTPPTPRDFLRGLLRPHRRWLHLAWLAGLGAAAATVAFAGSIAWLVHQSLFAPGQTGPWPWLGLALAAAVLRYGLQTLRDWSGQRLAFAVRGELRARLAGTAARIGPVHLGQRGHSGAWASRYQEQVDALGGYFARYLPALGLAFAVPLLLLATAFALDWIAGLLLLLSAPLIPVFMALIGMGSQQIHEEQQERQNRLAGHFLDRIRNLDLLRRSLALDVARAEVATAAHGYRRLSMRVLRVAFLSSAVMEFFSAIAIGLVAIYVGFALLGFLEFGPAGKLALFPGLFVLLLAPEYFQPLRQFAQSYHDRAGAVAAASALAPLLQPATRGQPPAPSLPAPTTGPLLRLEGARVRYDPKGPPALQGVHLEIAAGERVGLVGPSGSGKSTLLALCAGFVAADSGTVTRAPAAARFAWIGQRAHLFHGSLRENLHLAAGPDATDAELATALQAAGLPVHDPTLPLGLDTPIGEASRGISGGQAQRVALARALLSGSRLWLLDEPTSALDRETAEDLLARLLRHASERGITLLLATHQIEIARRMTRILRLEAGQLCEDRRV